MADDKPFDFNLDAVKAEVDLAPWRVHWGGKRWEFKHPQDIDVWQILDKDGGEVSQSEAMVQVFEVALGAKQFEQFRKIGPLPTYKLKALFEAYQAYGGVKVGESEGSSDS